MQRLRNSLNLRRRRNARRDAARLTESLEDRRLLTLAFDFNYAGAVGTGVGFEDAVNGQARRDALEAAAEQFGQQFADDATITVDVSSIEDSGSSLKLSVDSGLLDTGATFGGIEVVRNKILNGTDLNGAVADATLNANFGIDWELSADPGDVSGSEYDFYSAVLHELTHVVGFNTTPGELGTSLFGVLPGFAGRWSAFDQFLEDSAGNAAIDNSGTLNAGVWTSAIVGGASPGNGLFFGGTNAKAANSGNAVGLYSPGLFADGESGSHLDNDNAALAGSLMLSGTATGPGPRGYTDIEEAILKDLGYSMVPEGVTVTESDSSTSVSESGTTDTLTVVLDAPPLTDVVLSVASADPAEVTPNVSSLTFTPGNWNVPQTVTLTGVNDMTEDGDQSIDVTIAVVDLQSSLGYQLVPDRVVATTVVDIGTILETDGTVGDDELILTLTGLNQGTVSRNGVTTAFNGFDGFVFEGLAGNDTLTVNLNGQAFPTNGITFNGAAGLNRLSVNGSDTETAVMTLDATTFGSGSIDFGTAAAQFTRMESIDTADFADLTTRLTGHDENLTANKGLDYLSGLVQVVRLSGSSGGANVPNTSYASHGSVALDTTRDDGDDTIAIHALDNAHGIGGFALNTGLGNDSVQLLGNVVTQGDFVLTDPLAIAADVAVTSVGGDVQLSGALDLGANTLTLNAAGSNSQLAGIVSGTGDLNLTGSGTTNLLAANTFTGTATATAGSIRLHDADALGPNGSATGVVIGAGAELVLADSVTINRPLDLAGTLSVADGEQAVWAGPVTVSGNDAALNVGSLASLNVSGDLSSSSGFTKQGDGALSLTGSANSVGGTTLLSDGDTLLEGNDLVDGPVTVANGATLTAQGCLPGSVTIQTGGNLTPGDGVAILQTGDLDLQSGSTLNMQVAGIETAGTDFDQLDVVGSVTLAGALNLLDTSAATGQVNDRITLIRNDGSDAVNGTFSNLAQGASVTLNGETWRILYNGGDGNDVELVFGTPLVTVGDVTVTEADSGTVNATFSVTVDSPLGSAFRVSFETAHSSTSADDFTASSGTLSFDGLTAGETQVVTVTVAGDEVVELNESFFLNLTGILDTNVVTFADQQAVGTITNDDAAAFSIDDVTVVEGDAGDTSATLTVTLSEAVDTAMALNFATQDTTAVAGSDYTDGSGTLNFAGQKGETKTISINVSGDELVELNESFQVNLSNLVAAGRNVSIADAAGTVTITNDDAAAFTINDVAVVEGDNGTTTATLTVTLDDAVDTALALNFATADGTAVAGTDYTAASGTLNFTGQQGETRTLTVSVAGDELVELNETLQVNLSNLLAAGRDVTIADTAGLIDITNDDAATFSIGDVTVAEGDTGTAVATLSVTLNEAVDTALSVSYATADGSAVAGDDYSSGSGNLNFEGSKGETETISINVSGDQLVELDETLLVNLSNLIAFGRDVTIADAVGQIDISNDDTAAFSIGDVTVTEGDVGTTTATLTVTLDEAVDRPVTLNYATSNNTAVADSDYSAVNGVLTFSGQKGETRTVSIDVSGDELVEREETFNVNLSGLVASGRNVTLADTAAQVTIFNDETATFSIDDAVITEGDTGSVTATLTVTLDEAVDTALALDFTTADATATAGSDYTATSGSLNFTGQKGETATITVSVAGDELVELDETVAVNLSGLTADGRNVSIADSVGQVSITNDEAATISIRDSEIVEGDEGYRNMVFRMSMDTQVDTAVFFDADTANDTAVAGQDYTTASKTMVFPAGATTELTYVVRVTGDTTAELNESFLVQLSNINAGNRAVTFADAEAIGNIQDTDPRSASLTMNSSNASESAESVVLLTVTTPLEVLTDQFVSIDVTGPGITAGDVLLSTSRIRIPAGQTTGTATLTVVNDDLVEQNEIATIALVNPTNGLQIQNGSQQLQLISDDAADVTISPVSVDEGDAGTSTARFAVTLDRNVDTTLQLDFTTADDTATTADNDFEAKSGQLTFVGNAAEVRYIDVTINGDEKIESDETFQLLLSNLQAGGRPVRFAQAGAIGTIINDDMANNINLSADTTTGTERDGSVITLTATTTQPVTGDQSVSLSIGGAHVEASDYQLSQQTLVIPDGQTAASASFTVLQDDMLEGSETATVTLVNPSEDLTIGENASVALTIADDTPIHINSIGNFPGAQPTISWQAVPAAVRYEVWFARVFPSEQRIYSDTQVTDTQWSVPDELTPGFYRYWVRAFDQHDHVGRWSSSQAFEVRPTLLGPLKPTFDGTPTFSWEPIAHTPGYQLFIRTREGDMIQNNLTETSWTPDEALPYGQIRWWIRPSDAIQNRGWSRVGITNVDRRTRIEDVSVSADGRPTFTWQDVQGVRHHSIYVQNLTTGELAFRRDRVQGTTYTHNSSLSSGTFRVWVKTIGENPDHGAGRWSCFVDFTVTSTEQERDELLAESFTPELTSLPTETAAGLRKDEGVRSTESTAEAVSYSAEEANDAAGTGRSGKTTTQTAATPSGGLVVESEQAAVTEANFLDEVLAELAISELLPSGS